MGPVITLVASIAAGPAMLLLWSLIYPGGCWSLLLPAVVAFVLMLAGRERMLWRRRCLADCLFVEGSALHRVLRSRILISLLALIVATGLTAVLAAAVPAWQFHVLLLLALDALVIAALYFSLYRLAAGGLQVNRPHRALFARRLTVAVNVPGMVLALLFIQLQQPPPDYLDEALRLRPTLQAATSSIASDCPAVDSVVRLGREAEAISWWLILRATQTIGDTHLRWVAWVLFLLSGTLSLWAYSSFCVQLIHFAHRRTGAA